MTCIFTPKQLWIGAIEVRSLQPDNYILEDTKGAFVNIVAWARNSDEYQQNVDLSVSELGLFIGEVVSLEPVETRREREGQLTEEIEDMVSRAQANPNAIIYGTFHTFENDNA